jgi:hypothetical protein
LAFEAVGLVPHSFPYQLTIDVLGPEIREIKTGSSCLVFAIYK